MRSPRRSVSTLCCTKTSKAFFNGFPRDACPMPVLSSAVSALSTFYQDSLDPFDEDAVKLSTSAAGQAAHDHRRIPAKSMGQPFLYPDNSLGLVENFLWMTFEVPGRAGQGRPGVHQGAGPAAAPAPDHEQNCSTSTVRMVGSARRISSRRSRPGSSPCSGRRRRRTRPCCRCSGGSGGRAAASKRSSSASKNRKGAA